MAAIRDIIIRSSPSLVKIGIPRVISRCLIMGKFTMLPAATAQNGTKRCNKDNLLKQFINKLLLIYHLFSLVS